MRNTDPSLTRWLIARRITLSAIVIAGTMTTAAAVSHRLGAHDCQALDANNDANNGTHTYSGIGVELTQDGDTFVVNPVFRGTPADGVLYPGAVLIAVDGETPTEMRAWTRAIRGRSGTSVELEVAYPCSGHETVDTERATFQIRY